MTTTSPTGWAPDDPIAGRLVIVGCSRRKRHTDVPVPALELYEGGCVPQLRARIGAHPRHRTRVRILSAEHGILTADTPLLPYDRALDTVRAHLLRPRVAAALLAEAAGSGMPRHVLAVAESRYLYLITDLFADPDRRPALTWIPHHLRWPAAATVLDAWGWP